MLTSRWLRVQVCEFEIVHASRVSVMVTGGPVAVAMGHGLAYCKLPWPMHVLSLLATPWH